MIRYVIPGEPVTKKNSQQILVNKRTGRPFIAPSKKYKEYLKHCEKYIPLAEVACTEPVTVKCVYYMSTKRKVDMTNLLEATHDILVSRNVLQDDCNRIIKSVDGSRVEYDKEHPRVEIEISPFI